MFARLSMGAAQLLDVSFQASSSSLPEDEFDSVLQVDLTALRSLMNTLPTEDTWRRVRNICQNSISPVYQSIQTMVIDDVERITQVLSDLESCNDELHPSLPSSALADASDQYTPISLDSATGHLNVSGRGSLGKIHPRKDDSHVQSTNCQPIVIPSSHPSAPTIIITPCLAGQRETSCRIPYQNNDFGNMLTVPLHPAFNKVYPPMAPMKDRTPVLSKWIWRSGHWEAVIPSLEEQHQKGLFSRMHAGRRKVSRAHSTI
ncbi:hypothetical protein BDQ17DRAFT_1345356 [Cyathus striatus]|nr:hypothetical protein BDQ17DRAFT_1345356 [Cyathus striatus]